MNLPAPMGSVSYFQFHPHPFDFAQGRLLPSSSRERDLGKDCRRTSSIAMTISVRGKES